MKAEWRPIETAPKDGTRVLLHYPLEDLGNGWPRELICYWHTKDGYWVFDQRACRAYSDAYQPTHWMPLPEPPEPHHAE